ncbi:MULTISPECIES: hypothetical protein [unclassified Fusibacter]|uniref:hypothetical protein n=1 Tax=unclassified Fusibacter TaxID=2624464 RepID=UPI001012FC3D|nr:MULTISPECIES: hypothetical protein [unclassified Fusibacter]MCK8058149.1 hypothetical protein [Fusibacter sp. A2]NPE20731.1 hypothetical protein [Fusibacter sp. A1]RXV62937.1 hypothetical protein DWB64_02785 [Fusibacter sp. A1]
MQIICVIYDESMNKVLIRHNENELNLVSIKCDEDKDYFTILQAHLSETIGFKLIKSDLSTIAKSEDYIVLLLNADCSDLTNFEWVDLENLKTITGVDKTALSQLLNYFLRINKFKMESLYFSIRCQSRKIIDDCVNLIQRNNPGIAIMDKYQAASVTNSAYKIVLIRDVEPESSDFVEEIKLVTCADDENKTIDSNHIAIETMQIEDIYKEVMNKVSELYQKKVMENTVYSSCFFYGVTGMTESGKSYFANHLDLTYNMWNLKIRSFIEVAKCLVDHSISPLLEVITIQLMLEFSCYHYFKQSLVIESIYSERIHCLFSDLLKDKYKLIYIDVDEDQRKKRSLDSLDEFKSKDIKKRKLGIDKLRNIADIKLDNSKSISASKNQLDHYFRSC